MVLVNYVLYREAWPPRSNLGPLTYESIWERCGTIPLKQTPVPCAIPSCHATISSSGSLDGDLLERDWACQSPADCPSNPTSSVVIGRKPDLFPFLFFFFTVHTYFILKQKNSSGKEGELKPPLPRLRRPWVSYTLYWQMTSLSRAQFRTLHPF